MHILHISFRKSNRNNLFNYILETKNVHVTAYDFFDPHDYKILENDNYEYDALVLRFTRRRCIGRWLVPKGTLGLRLHQLI